MTLILFAELAGKTCSVVSPLLEDFYANFGGDPFTGDALHDSFMRSVFFRIEWPYGKLYAPMALRSVSTWPHYPKNPGMWWILSFLTGKCTTGRALLLDNIKGKTTTKVIKTMVVGHHELMLYSLKTILGGVNLVGLSLSVGNNY